MESQCPFLLSIAQPMLYLDYDVRRRRMEALEIPMVQWNPLLVLFLVVYVFQVAFDLFLDELNLRHLRRWGNAVPVSFQGFIDAARLAKIRAYTLARSRPGRIHSIMDETLMLALILGGFPAVLEDHITRLFVHPVVAGLLFFTVFGLISRALELPFDYYQTFVVEEKFGFNRSTFRIWAMDHVKSGIILLILFLGLMSAILFLISIEPRHWWVWSFLLVSAVQFVVVVLYPVLIAPLFNRFEPIRDDLLARRIHRLMEENGIQVKRILQMDAGKRSRHSNAYFTGLGKTKQIVLFDTLLETHPHEEIVAVLAHEIGHFKRRHILKQIMSSEVIMLAAFYAAYRFLDWPLLYTTFGFPAAKPYVGLFFLGIVWQKLGYFLQPLFMAVSRRYERQADLFAARLLKTAKPLKTALKRMASENLSNLTPHPLYVRFHYSHPPLMERIESLDKTCFRPVREREGQDGEKTTSEESGTC